MGSRRSEGCHRLCLPHFPTASVSPPENEKRAKSLRDMLKAIIRKGNRLWRGKHNKSHAKGFVDVRNGSMKSFF